MVPKTKLNLKERLEDGELDLSLSDLQEVPVKEIALLKKATSLDLSNNRLTSLGKNFIILTNIVKLDLSKNLLTKLPEDFGEMKQLKHLDLYSNNLTHLPLSFHKLRALRWLDLKNNPLVPALAKVAGPCLEAPQCIHCARNVVSFFARLNEQVEQEKARREAQRQASLVTPQESEQPQKQAPKKKEKKKVKAKKPKVKSNKNQEPIQRYSPDIYNPNFCSKNNRSSKRPKTNVCVSLFKFSFYTIVLTILSLSVFCSLKTDSAVALKLKIVDLWGEALDSVPSTWTPYAVQFGEQVQYLHAFTERFVDRATVYINEFRENEIVKNIMEASWNALILLGTEFKDILSGLRDQAVIWTNEIKKIIV